MVKVCNVLLKGMRYDLSHCGDPQRIIERNKIRANPYLFGHSENFVQLNEGYVIREGHEIGELTIIAIYC